MIHGKVKLVFVGLIENVLFKKQVDV